MTGQTLSLRVEKPAAGGRMIARVGGQVVLVSGAIPGERVAVQIERVAKGVAYAATVAVEEPSGDRRTPFSDPLCGGCLYGYINYPRQVEIKSVVIADAFHRIAHLQLPGVVSVAPSPEEGYRMRARLHLRGQRFGFFREGTHEVCDARATRQLLPATCDVLERIAAGLRALGAHAVLEIELSENVRASERVVHFDAVKRIDTRTLQELSGTEGLSDGPYVTDVLAIAGHPPIKFRRHVRTFCQGNRYLLCELVAHVVEQVAPGSEAIDLYAGAGLFAVSAAITRGARVTAVEGDPLAAADLSANAAAADRAVFAVHQAVELFVQTAKGGAGTLIVDPPRTGMSREALNGVIRLRAGRIIYVSCDVATLARDARRLADAGYAIARIDAFDLFPNTPHVETVVVFSRTACSASP